MNKKELISKFKVNYKKVTTVKAKYIITFCCIDFVAFIISANKSIDCFDKVVKYSVIGLILMALMIGVKVLFYTLKDITY